MDGQVTYQVVGRETVFFFNGSEAWYASSQRLLSLGPDGYLSAHWPFMSDAALSSGLGRRQVYAAMCVAHDQLLEGECFTR